MARIKRGGRELVVADSEVTGYLREGYSVIDDRGNELTPAKAMTYTQAMNENIVLKKRNEQLQAQLKMANDLNVELRKQLEAAKKAAEDALNGSAADKPTETLGNKAGATGKTATPVQANKSLPAAKPAQKGQKQP